MIIVFTLFKLISTLIINLLYEKSMVNNLYEINLDKKIISIREPENKKKKLKVLKYMIL